MDKTEKLLKTSEALVTILQTDDGINNYLKKADLKIGENQLQVINKVLQILSENSPVVNEQFALNELLETLSEIMEDGKLKLNEMIKLVNVLVKNVKNINVDAIEFGNDDVGVLLKLLIIILDETNVIDIKEQENMIFTSIDTCVFLINQMGEIKIEICSAVDDNRDKYSDDKTITNPSPDKQNNNNSNSATTETNDNLIVNTSTPNVYNNDKENTPTALVVPVIDEKASCKCLWFKFSF